MLVSDAQAAAFQVQPLAYGNQVSISRALCYSPAPLHDCLAPFFFASAFARFRRRHSAVAHSLLHSSALVVAAKKELPQPLQVRATLRGFVARIFTACNGLPRYRLKVAHSTTQELRTGHSTQGQAR